MIIRKDQATVDRLPAEDAQTFGARESVHLTEDGGLTQFVAHVQTLCNRVRDLPTGTGTRRKTSSSMCCPGRRP